MLSATLSKSRTPFEHRALTRFSPVVALLLLALSPARTQAHCDYQDQAACACFVQTGAWPATTVDGQVAATAENTLGTTVSCVPYGGQPYWQIQLQVNDPVVAELIADLALWQIAPIALLVFLAWRHRRRG